MNTIILIIGNKIKKRRKELGLTQKELASRAKMSRILLNRLENGRLDNIGVITIAKLSEVLKMEIWDFFIPDVKYIIHENNSTFK